MRLLATLLTMVLVFVAGHSVAQNKLYKVTDRYGNVTYQDTPPSDDADFQTRTMPLETEAAEPEPEPTVDQARLRAAAAARPLVLFTVPTCDSCDFLRWYLNDRGLPFEEFGVEGNIENQMRLKEATGEYRVPVLMIGETPLFGYDSDRLAAELVDAGYLAPLTEPATEEDGTVAAPDGQAPAVE
ncbi:MAG: glutaredoxin family protein [Proteobacteria bacterium]|nr:MAG: glutaredoxin family protein [Pseudomonadota bacterium]